MKRKSTPVRNYRVECCNHRRITNISHHRDRHGFFHSAWITEDYRGRSHPHQCGDESREGEIVFVRWYKRGTLGILFSVPFLYL